MSAAASSSPYGASLRLVDRNAACLGGGLERVVQGGDRHPLPDLAQSGIRLGASPQEP
jgi:hypothetical protein